MKNIILKPTSKQQKYVISILFFLQHKFFKNVQQVNFITKCYYKIQKFETLTWLVHIHFHCNFMHLNEYHKENINLIPQQNNK